MIEARRSLVGLTRDFVTRELSSVYSWDELVFDTPDPMPRREDGRRSLLGKFRERIMVRFDRYALEVRSSADDPPLGSVKLFDREKVAVRGPIDARTWSEVGAYLREKHNGD